MPILSSTTIAEICKSIIQAAGATPEAATIFGESLANANLVGEDSMGIQTLPSYINLIHRGSLKPKAQGEIVRQTPATALVDGKWGLGQSLSREAMQIAVDKAKKCGTSSVGIFNCSPVGRLGDYSVLAAKKNMIGLIFANTDPSVAPWGEEVPYSALIP